MLTRGNLRGSLRDCSCAPEVSINGGRGNDGGCWWGEAVPLRRRLVRPFAMEKPAGAFVRDLHI